MARCKKCNVEIPEGKELCAGCEQLNSESYLDSLLHAVTSDDPITFQAENAKNICFGKKKAKIDPNTTNVSKIDVQDSVSEEMLTEPEESGEAGETVQVPDGQFEPEGGGLLSGEREAFEPEVSESEEPVDSVESKQSPNKQVGSDSVTDGFRAAEDESFQTSGKSLDYNEESSFEASRLIEPDVLDEVGNMPFAAESVVGETLPGDEVPQAEAPVPQEPGAPEDPSGFEGFSEPEKNLNKPHGTDPVKTDILSAEKEPSEPEAPSMEEFGGLGESGQFMSESFEPVHPIGETTGMDSAEETFAEDASGEGFVEETEELSADEIFQKGLSLEGQNEESEPAAMQVPLFAGQDEPVQVGIFPDEAPEDSVMGSGREAFDGKQTEDIGSEDVLRGEKEFLSGNMSGDFIPSDFGAGSGQEDGTEKDLMWQGDVIDQSDREPADMPRKETDISVADYAADDKNDKYMLTPEEEAAFEFDIPKDLEKEDDWDGADYDIFGEDAPSDDEFDGMLREIADAGSMPMLSEPEALTAGDSAKADGGTVSEPETVKSAGKEKELIGIRDLPSGDGLPKIDVLSGSDDSLQADVSSETKDLLRANDTSQTNILSQNVNKKEGIMAAATNEAENDEFNSGAETQEDILDLINSLYNSDEEPSFTPTENVASGEPYGTEDDLEMSGQQDDLAGMLSDVLPDGDFSSIPDIREMEEKEEAAGKKKKEKKKKKVKDKAKAKDKNKPSFMHRLFGNIKTERSEEEIAQMKEKIIADAEAKEAAKEAKAAKAAAEKEEKKKKAAEDKAAAAKKKQEKAKKKAEDAKAKKEAKDKKKQEVQNLIDAIDEDEGRINRVGASIVFVLFAVVAVAVLIGTKLYSYKQSIENAKENFEYDHYNEAYEEIAGLEMKEEDENFSLQVKVVMYTYKQLNSFNNYYTAGMYPEALDSLLKGLKRYDKYFPIARVLEVDEDLVQIRGEILEKLQEVYSLTEQDAVELTSLKSREAYSRQVYDIAGKVTE